MKIRYLLLIITFLSSLFSYAQTEEEEEEEDYSIYEQFGSTGQNKVKRYASPKILGISPAKLISVGYDVQGPNQLTADSIGAFQRETTTLRATHGMRILINLPVISYTKLLINVGATYIETNYEASSRQTISNPYTRSLLTNGLRSMGVNTTVFKPFSEKSFALGFISADMNGDFRLSQLQPLSDLKYTWALMYGRRPHDRKQYAIGVTQSYRAGEVNLFPVILYNFTSANRKWGIEAMLPARLHFRRTINARNLILLGYELEGQSYRLNNRQGYFPPAAETRPHYNVNNLELRRSEIRARIIYERGFSDFIWLSAQFGYVINYRNKVDSGDFLRGFFGDQLYVMENKLTNPLYFNISLNLVSP
ncbi:MAG: hypothetical protein ACK40G_11250 [Cytophagaceae bacterium]